METDGLQRLSATHNKTLNNDEAHGCARRVHFTKFIMEIFEYYPLNCDNAVQVGPRTAKTLISRQINLKIRVFPFVFAEYVA